MDYAAILEEIQAEVQPCLGQGKVASYIPELAKVPPQQFGMALYSKDGELFEVGQAQQPFSMQSISKVFTLMLAMRFSGDDVWQRVGREPSGNAFNSLVQLEHECGVPRNPFINAGALVITDIILAQQSDAKTYVLDWLQRLSCNPSLAADNKVYHSELATGHRNLAMAHFMRSFGNLHNTPDAVMQAYCYHCAIAMSCVDLCKASAFLVHGGYAPCLSEAAVTASQAKYLNAIMLTCGAYDAAGDFAYRIGLPCKSGVGGGIIAVLPGKFSVCVWAPGLDTNGNSLAGGKALELLTSKTGLSVF